MVGSAFCCCTFLFFRQQGISSCSVESQIEILASEDALCSHRGIKNETHEAWGTSACKTELELAPGGGFNLSTRTEEELKDW